VNIQLEVTDIRAVCGSLGREQVKAARLTVILTKRICWQTVRDDI